MTVSSSYGQMQQQIAIELGYRTDLFVAPTYTPPSGYTALSLSPIQNAIQNAIAKYERQHFYFNEIAAPNTTFTTVPGQEYYTSSAAAVIGTNPHIDKIWVLISSNRYSLNPRTEQYISDTSLNPSVQGQPIDYSYYAEQLRFYPIPDGAYPITIEGVQRLSALSAATDTNAWMQDAEALIRAEAKCELYENILKVPELADRQRVLIHGDPSKPADVGYLFALKKETMDRQAVPKMRASYF